MWTATLIRAEKRNGRLDFEIEYLDDSDNEITRISYSLNSATKKQIRDLARREVARLDTLKSVVIDLPIGQSINIDPDAVTPPSDPTPEELARRAWFDDYQKLRSMLQVAETIPALLTAQTQTAIDNLRVTLEADWENSYLEGV